jgi:hypothetical protein
MGTPDSSSKSSFVACVVVPDWIAGLVSCLNRAVVAPLALVTSLTLLLLGTTGGLAGGAIARERARISIERNVTAALLSALLLPALLAQRPRKYSFSE